MIKFRPVRRTLDEAMREVREFNTFKDLQMWIVQEYGLCTEDDVSLERQGFDRRIGWDSHFVLIGGQAYGYTDRGEVDVPA